MSSATENLPPAPWRAGETVGGKRWIYDRNNVRVAKVASDMKKKQRAYVEALISKLPELIDACEMLLAGDPDHAKAIALNALAIARRAKP